MIQTITKSMFRDAFQHTDRKDTFSYEGLGVLFDHLEELDENMELDVIGICCDFTEDTVENVLKQYSMESLEELRDSTCVLRVNEDTIIYGVF